MMTLVAYLAHLMHNHTVLQTKSIRGESRKVPRRMNRHMAGFFRPYANVRLLWAGDDREGKSPAGSLGRRSLNPVICPPTPFESGERVNHPSKEACTMATTLARSAHTFPQTEKAARRAVRRWFAGTPYLSLAEWRDQSRLVHCARLPADPAREAAFDQAFAQELAAVIVGGASHV